MLSSIISESEVNTRSSKEEFWQSLCLVGLVTSCVRNPFSWAIKKQVDNDWSPSRDVSAVQLMLGKLINSENIQHIWKGLE